MNIQAAKYMASTDCVEYKWTWGSDKYPSTQLMSFNWIDAQLSLVIKLKRESFIHKFFFYSIILLVSPHAYRLIRIWWSWLTKRKMILPLASRCENLRLINSTENPTGMYFTLDKFKSLWLMSNFNWTNQMIPMPPEPVWNSVIKSQDYVDYKGVNSWNILIFYIRALLSCTFNLRNYFLAMWLYSTYTIYLNLTSKIHIGYQR